MKKTGVSQKAIILSEKGKFLILHRTSTAPSNPNTWDLPGGDLDFGEDVIQGIIREIKEETGLMVKDVKLFDVKSYINKKDEFWVTIAYIAKSKSDKVELSFEHDKSKWVTSEEFLKLKSSAKLRHFIKNLNRNRE